MKNTRLLVIVTIILACLLTFTFADDVAKTVQAVESNAGIIYNGREVALGIKPFSIQGYNYLSVRSVADLFNKNIEWNQAERKIIISDKPDLTLDNLKSELAAKDKSIAELQDKVKKLEKDQATVKNPGIRQLQDEMNYALGEFEGLLYKVVLSGNEDEIRVKIEVDLNRNKSAWNGLTRAEREALVEEVYSWISGDYETAKIKGYITDISTSEKLMTFHYNWKGELASDHYKNYNEISSLEDKLNNDYSDYFEDMHFSIALMGNDNCVEFFLNIQGSRFGKEWEGLSDNSLRAFMKKLCGEIQLEFGECQVYGYVYDTDNEAELAECEQQPNSTFIFDREQ